MIGRELFPTSDCLKAGQREPMIHKEILQQDADIICLQVGPEKPSLAIANDFTYPGSGPFR